jgi:hypothetical protein
MGEALSGVMPRDATIASDRSNRRSYARCWRRGDETSQDARASRISSSVGLRNPNTENASQLLTTHKLKQGRIRRDWSFVVCAKSGGTKQVWGVKGFGGIGAI